MKGAKERVRIPVAREIGGLAGEAEHCPLGMPFTPFRRVPRGLQGALPARYGFLRPIIPEVVEKFLEGGDLARGFSRIQCDHCKSDPNGIRNQ